ncbi:MAG: EAL domain-containing protein [Candidatus Thiodiazotropha sp. LLP2]
MTSVRFYLALLILIVLEASVLLFNYGREVAHNLALVEASRQTAVTSVLDSYQHIFEVFYDELFNLPPTAALLSKAANSEESAQDELREHLYKRFISSFKNLQHKGIHTLQFILPDGRSFLRFNNPELYGDQVMEQRPMLKSVMNGFPQGGIVEYDPVYPSFRFAFPIKQDNTVVGIVDLGVSFEAIRNALIKLASMENTHYWLLLKESNFASAINPEDNNLYRRSNLKQEFLVEKLQTDQDLVKNLNRIESYLKSNQDLQQALDSEQGFTTETCLQTIECYTVNLQVLHDSNQHATAYILSYTTTEQLRHLRSSHLIAFLLGTILISITLYTFSHWLQITQRLRTITDHMAEGLYVTDTAGKLMYVNPTACEILQYNRSQLLGRSVQDLLYSDEQGRPLRINSSAIQKHNISGTNYRSDDEHLRCQDGTTIRASVVCSPVWTNGVLSGSVVLFRDITQEYEIKRRQQRSDVALSSLAEGVMVTTAEGRVEAVNKAFSEITGYQENEILGKNPSLLKSGQHDELFYQNMWDQLILEGQWEGEIWNRRKNGQIYPELLRITSVIDEDGNITEYVATFSDITEKRQHEMQLHNLAYTDPLTELHNRAAFIETFGHALAHAQRRHTRCALLYLDLDRFKKINDTLGHDIGDKVLIESAQRLNQAVRNEDEVARLGGDEFIVLLEDIRQDDAPARVARKIVSLLGQPITLDPHTMHVTASIGIAIYPDDGNDTTTLLKNADAAMYMAKREGRNGFHYFTPAMAEKEENRFKLEIDLHKALMNEEFLLQYQPKVNLLSGETTGFEALLYWQHPKLGLLSADQFLAIAHDAGVMRDITHWIINESSSQMLEWLDQGLEPGRMAINIDTHTFNSSDAYDQICRTVELTGVNPGRIELEISESGLLEKPVDDPFWNQLVHLGYSLSIDNFGTGVSSLYRLKHFPVTTLNIDQSFIQNIEHDEDDRTIIRTVVAMGKSLGLSILARGIENQTQLDFLCKIGCNQGQGQLFAKPQSSIDITNKMASERYRKRIVETTHH